jgi:hypothetical protein
MAGITIASGFITESDVDLTRWQCFPGCDSLELIKIRLGKWKCISDQFHSRLCIIRDNDFNNIKSKENIGIIQHSQPGQSPTRNALSFFSINRFERPAKIFAAAGLYFDKHQCVIVTTDNIDLTAAATAEIAQEDLVTVTLEVASR